MTTPQLPLGPFALVRLVALLPGALIAARAQAVDVRTIEPPLELRASGECELVLRMHYEDPDAATEVYAVTTDASKRELKDRYLNGICIKAKGDDIRLPQDILLWVSKIGEHEEGLLGGQLCRAESARTPTPNDEWGTCSWSGIYRNQYPFSFELEAQGPLRNVLSSVRIYRNSEVAYAWSPTPVDHAADGGARKIVVHGVELRRRRLPHLADFDLVLAGADIQIDEVALDAASQEQRLVFERRVEAALRGAAAEGTDESSDELRCLRAQLIDPQQVADACEKSELPRDLVPDVAAEFKQLRGKSAEAVSLLERSLAARFDRLEATILEVTAEAAEHRGDKSLLLAGKDLTRAVQDLKRWTSTLRAGAVNVQKRESAASLYAAMTRRLPQSESIFEARRPNPLPAEGEHVLNMRYGDNSQWYGLAGWNGVPMRVKEAVGFDFKATVVVPIVDVIGWRLQWGPSRLSEFRLAVGGLVFQEEDLTTDETDDTVLHVGPQINMSLGTLRVGLAYAANQDQAGAGEQLRVLFGVDLIKLISGENFEAF